jgi:osmoprotectant transport system substrate-binding protein
MTGQGLTRRGFTSAALLLCASRGWAGAPIVVGTKLDLEGALLGHIVLLALEAAGIATENQLQLGPTAIVRAAILSGAIDLTVEYSGNAAMFFHQEGDPLWKDAAAGYRRAAALDLRANDLVWLAPAPADNTWVIAVPALLSDQKGLHTMEDFAAYVQAGGRVKLAASAEFVESPAGLPAFEATYGFTLTAKQLLVLSGGETSATMKAAADGISGVNAAMAYGTDGALVALGLVALEDTRHAEPVYAPAPVVRAAVLEAEPRIRDVLAPAFAGLDLDTLRGLNAKVAVDGEPAAAVARAYLHARGLLDRAASGTER